MLESECSEVLPYAKNRLDNSRRGVDCSRHRRRTGADTNVARRSRALLSDTQRSQIKTKWEGERPNISELVREFASEQKEMDAFPFQNGAADEGRIQDITAREGATLAKLLGEKEKLTGKIYSQVLNPGQRTKADELRKCWSSRLEHVADRIGNTTGTK